MFNKNILFVEIHFLIHHILNLYKHFKKIIHNGTFLFFTNLDKFSYQYFYLFTKYTIGF